MPRITTFLTYADQAEEAVNLYTSIFPTSRILEINRYGDTGPGGAGSVMTATFELDGQRFQALNGGPSFRFSDGVSLYIDCADQAEVDYYWEKLGVDGGEPGQCGWLKDRFGVSWQVIPRALGTLLGDPDPARARRALEAMLGMTRLDIAELERAANG